MVKAGNLSFCDSEAEAENCEEKKDSYDDRADRVDLPDALDRKDEAEVYLVVVADSFNPRFHILGHIDHRSPKNKVFRHHQHCQQVVCSVFQKTLVELILNLQCQVPRQVRRVNQNQHQLKRKG